MVRLFAFCILAISVCLSGFADDPKVDSDAPVKKPVKNEDFDFEIDVIDNKIPAVTFRLRVNKADADSIVRCWIRIKNGSDKPLTFNSVSASCTCTNIKVLNETVEPGEESFADLYFPALRLADSGSIDAVINTTGVLSKIYINITGELTNVAKFRNNIATLEFDSESVTVDNAIVDYEIPIVASDDLSPNDLLLKYDPKLPIVRHAFAEKDGKRFVIVSVDTGEVDPNGISGEIELFRKNVGKGVSVPCHIRRGSRVTISPKGLAFANVESVTAFLRIKALPNKKIDDLVINSITDKAGLLSIEYKSIAVGVYRLSISRKAQPKEVDAPKGIIVSVDTSEGQFDRYLSVLSW